MQKSPRKFDVPSTSTLTSFISIKEVIKKTVFHRVSFHDKVIHTDDTVKLSGGLTKQEITLADSSVNTLEVDKSYSFEKMTVKSYRNEKQLSKPKDGATITLIPDILNVVEDDLPLDYITLHGVQVVVGIQNLLCYPTCFSCSAKVNALMKKKNTCCSKCGIIQPMQNCKQQLATKLYIQSGDKFLSLSAFGHYFYTLP